MSAGTVAATAAMFLFAAASFGQGPGYPPGGAYGPPPANPYANVYVPPPAAAPAPVYAAPAPSPQTYILPAATDSQPNGWTVGAGLYYFQPRWGTNPAYATSVLSSDGGQSAQEDFSSKGGFAPLLWLGYVADNGLGVRGRWWQFTSPLVRLRRQSPADRSRTSQRRSIRPIHGRGLCGGQQPGR